MPSGGNKNNAIDLPSKSNETNNTPSPGEKTGTGKVMGKNGREFILSNLSKEVAVAKYVDIVKDVCKAWFAYHNSLILATSILVNIKNSIVTYNTNL